jgi:hypothetical protein
MSLKSPSLNVYYITDVFLWHRRLCVVFLAFDVFFVVFCVALACVIGIAVCCCLPCIIAILYAVADQVSTLRMRALVIGNVWTRRKLLRLK